MAETFDWTASTTEVTAANLNKMIDRSTVNMVRNSSFESWNGGVNSDPPGWTFTVGGGSIARYTLSAAGKAMCGTYCASIVKTTGDGAVSYLSQLFTPLMADNLQSRTFSASAKLQSVTATDQVSLYIEDDTGKTNSSYANATVQTLSVTKEISGAATFVKVGIECKYDSNYTAYIDDVIVVSGETVPTYDIPQTDYCPTLKYYDSDGTPACTIGAAQIVPFKIIEADPSGLAAAVRDTVSYTLPFGCDAVLWAHANVFSMGTTPIDEVNVTCNNYSATGFDILLYKITADPTAVAAEEFTANEAYELRGFAIVVGEDDGDEVFDW